SSTAAHGERQTGASGELGGRQSKQGARVSLSPLAFCCCCSVQGWLSMRRHSSGKKQSGEHGPGRGKPRACWLGLVCDGCEDACDAAKECRGGEERARREHACEIDTRKEEKTQSKKATLFSR